MSSASTPVAKPLVAILDGARDVTGSLLAARREAALLSDRARFMLLLTANSRIRPEDVPEFEEVLYLPGRLLRRDLSGIALYLPRLLRSGWRLNRILRGRHCRRLQVNDFYLMEGAIARVLGFGGRIVTWVRIDPAVYGGAISPVWLRLAERASDELVAVSQFMRTRLPRGLPTTLVYDPVPVVPTPARGITSSSRLLCIANYIVGKGHDIAIGAFHLIAREFPDAKLHFYGSAMGLAKNQAYRDGLGKLAASGPGAARIELRDFTSDPGRELNDCRCALVLSRSESFSLACLEASARGVPVIASRCGGPEEIVRDGATGLLVPVDDVEATAAAMRRMLGDGEAAAAMGRQGAERVRTLFSPEHFRAEMIRLLDL